jgi:hypothetical protein
VILHPLPLTDRGGPGRTDMSIRAFITITLLSINACLDAIGQTAPVTNGGGYSFPAPLPLAPGQLVTLLVTGLSGPLSRRAPAGVDLDTTLSGVSVGMEQISGGLNRFDLPILEVRLLQTCGNPVFGTVCLPGMAAVTVQAPFGMGTFDEGGGWPTLRVRMDGVSMYVMEVQTFPDQVHIVRAFDSILPNMERASPCFRSVRLGNMAPTNRTGLPCPPMVYRADGSLVSWANPAKAGEELSALAVGLGHTYPLAETGKVVKGVLGTAMEFAMDFNYRRNALGTRPPPVDTPGVPKPTYTAAKEGEVGLYEVRFIVPPVPPGTAPCAPLENLQGLSGENVVYSNLTFSIGGKYSFDGAGICVLVEEEGKE